MGTTANTPDGLVYVRGYLSPPSIEAVNWKSFRLSGVYVDCFIVDPIGLDEGALKDYTLDFRNEEASYEQGVDQIRSEPVSINARVQEGVHSMSAATNRNKPFLGQRFL